MADAGCEERSADGNCEERAVKELPEVTVSCLEN